MESVFEKHSNEVVLIVLAILLLGTLLVVVPQLLRASQRSQEMQHLERIKAIEQGQPFRPVDILTAAAGRLTALVPMVSVCAAATVTCFLAVYKAESTFAVSVTAWAAAGVVGLAAVTGGVALMGRMAHLQAGVAEPDDDDSPEGV